MQKIRDIGANILQVEETVCRHGPAGVEAAASVGRREPQTQKAGSGAQPG